MKKNIVRISFFAGSMLYGMTDIEKQAHQLAQTYTAKELLQAKRKIDDELARVGDWLEDLHQPHYKLKGRRYAFESQMISEQDLTRKMLTYQRALEMLGHKN